MTEGVTVAAVDLDRLRDMFADLDPGEAVTIDDAWRDIQRAWVVVYLSITGADGSRWEVKVVLPDMEAGSEMHEWRLRGAVEALFEARGTP